ncbi:hypothetical protein POJ06DRAFT_225298 [Lipomyces tetrasporus]|uniref:Dihydrodipicolinate synthase n=1 Tax=Lipomyces tetrasporus TaxID=54092 RepID=A0AAD7QNX3_9ASCO|nr:uncharacterized protein POJ06DRAFT_225298 [Lipomyces tetrasporus]KAJ8098520.1 hypothetical protein POJ06DRAFT_225298 [Lipomyces tetrasporus]
MTNIAAPPPGIYVPVPTFFVSKGSTSYKNTFAPALDLETQLAHSLYLAKAGIKGLVLLGSTGEAVHLTRPERTQLVSYVKEGLAKNGFDDFPLIVGTASNSVDETVTILTEAKESGGGWGMVLVPSYFASCVTQTGIIDWYTAVADISPIPIMIYYYPGVSNNVVVTPETISKLAAHPKIVGAKFSHGNISHHIIVAQNPVVKQSGFRVFTGLGQQLLPVLAVGCAGAIDGLAAFFPKSVLYIFNLVQEGKWDKANEIQYLVSSAEELIVKFGTVGIKEAVSRVLGFGDSDGCRPPLNGGFPDNEHEWEKWWPVMAPLARLEVSL